MQTLVAASTFFLISGPTAAATASATCHGGAARMGGCREHSLLQHSRLFLTKPARDLEFLNMADAISFDTVVRDFTSAHPDFESFDGLSTGLVEPYLGTDRKPIYKGGLLLSNQASFDQWYRDVDGVNKRIDFQMSFTKTADGTYMHEDEFFFPIDGLGWNDSAIALDNKEHNFYFTLELHAKFVFTGDEVFTFRGDDDVWVFINGKLVIDLGGVHNPMENTIALNDLNLTKRAAYDLDFFFAERRCCGSSFRIETSIKPVIGECVIWGDPHISAFDHGIVGTSKATAFNSVYSSGDYWLVKNSFVWIQGRYGPTRWTVQGQSALLALAVGGPFLEQGGQNHTLIIEPRDDGKVTWDDDAIVQKLPSEFLLPGFVRVTYKQGSKHIDEGQKHFPVEVVHARLPRMVSLTVNRWSRHIDAIIRSPQQLRGQDGHCGNFNLNPDDDTQDLIFNRIGSPLAGDSLFPTEFDVSDDQPTLEHTLDDCAPAVRVNARNLCQDALLKQEGALPTDGGNNLLDACVFDVCFGGKDFAEEDAVTESESEAMQS